MVYIKIWFTWTTLESTNQCLGLQRDNLIHLVLFSFDLLSEKVFILGEVISKVRIYILIKTFEEFLQNPKLEF